MGRYNETNLLKYEDTIRFHFDTQGKTAWLTVQNYGFVFGKQNEDASKVFAVTVGVPAMATGVLPEDKDDRDRLVGLEFKPGQFKPDARTISLGAMLDAIDVIKFQVQILKATSRRKGARVFNFDSLIFAIRVEFTKLFGAQVFNTQHMSSEPRLSNDTVDKLSRDWFGVLPDGAAVSKAIHDYSPTRVGFSAYFPDAGLIAQEERTKLHETDGHKGHTDNKDTRAIAPITASTNLPLGEGSETGFFKDQWEFSWIVDQLDIDIKAKFLDVQKTELPETDTTRLHARIARISCFGFRGDDRNPQQLKEAQGFLPGVTRNDFRYMQKFGNRATDLDATLPYLPVGKPDSPEAPFNKVLHKKLDPETPLTSKAIAADLQKYLDQIKNWSVMHLGDYTEQQDFKGYISATKSTAIAKHFSNAWRKDVDLTTYCYAVRCRGGFHLESTVTDPSITNAKEFLRTLHQFNSYAEQEVAVAGAIWWDHVVGMRTIRCNKDGQFFFGPVFLRADLMWEDNSAFSALFELLSGKSQGPAPGIIEKSYDPPPFESLPEVLASKGSNSMSPGLASETPRTRVAPSALTFNRQPVGTESAAQLVTITHIGNNALNVKSAQISGLNGGDFILLEGGRKERVRTYGIAFKPRGPFKPHKKWQSESNREHLLDERTATLEIKHNLAIKDQKISLTGTAVQAPVSWRLSAAELKFDKQAVGTTSAPQVLTLSIETPEPISITAELTGHEKEFELDGDFKTGVMHHTHTLRVSFSPAQEGERKAAIRIRFDLKKDPLTVALIGVAKKGKTDYTLSAKSLDFGKQPHGLNSTHKFGIFANTGSQPIVIEKIEVTGKNADAFFWASDSAPTVEPHQERSMAVWFRPNDYLGPYEAALEITSNATKKPITIALKGKAVDTILTPREINFGDVKAGTDSKPAIVTLQNLSDVTLEISAINFLRAAIDEFTWAAIDPGITTVAARASFLISVTFKPTSARAFEHHLEVGWRVNGTKESIKRTVKLIGQGIA